MLSKCANPSCGTPFLYLRHGKIFLMQHITHSVSSRSGAGSKGDSLEYFWLCGPCSEDLTLVHDSAHGVRVVQKKAKAKQAAA